MAIRTVTVPTPAAGVDWTYTIPGQWQAQLIGVTAQLATGAPVTTLPDETGNGHTASVLAQAKIVTGAQGPYGGGVDNYSVFGTDDVSAIGEYAIPAQSVAFNVASGTLECLIYVPTRTNPVKDGNGWGVLDNGQTIVRLGIGTDTTSGADPVAIGMVSNGSFRTLTAPGTVTRNAWHSLALTWDGVTFRAYIDGVLAGTHIGDMPAYSTAQPFLASRATNGDMFGYQAADAIYGAALSAVQLLAHYNARGSWAAYRAAVLADTPVAFWGLNTVASGPSRKVNLRVTNGTATVGEYPAAFASSTAVSFVWSWQVLGSSALATVSGTVNAVPIPAMTLTPGYTIGTHTLDLAGTDQWSAITVWFDDGTSGGSGQGWKVPPYTDALLVPQWWPNRPQ